MSRPPVYLVTIDTPQGHADSQEALFVLYDWPYARQRAVDLLTENAAAPPAA
jgi:hypothetical protein